MFIEWMPGDDIVREFVGMNEITGRSATFRILREVLN